MEQPKRKRGDRGAAIVTKLRNKNLDKTADEMLAYAACTLALLWGNKDKAYRHTAGCAAPASKNAGTQYFKSAKRESAWLLAQAEFEKTIVPHLEKYAKEKGLFFPSEANVENSSAKFEAVRKGIQANKRTKDDVLMELNLMVDAETDAQTKLQIYKTIADIDQMKKSEADDAKGLPSVCVLPPKNNIVLFGVEAYVDPSKKYFIEKEFAKIANPKKFGVLKGEE